MSPHRVPAFVQQLPEGVEIRPAGKAAGDADDGDGLLAGSPSGHGGRGRGQGQRELSQMIGERFRRGMIENRRRAEGQVAEVGLQSVAQVERHEGVHAQLEESGASLGQGVGIEAEHACGLVLHVRDDQVAPFGRGGLASRADHAADSFAGWSRRLRSGPDKRSQERRHGSVDARPVRRHHRHLRDIEFQHPLEGGQARGGIDRTEPAPGGLRQDAAPRRGADLAPAGPVDAHARQAPRPAMMGQRIQERIGRGVVSLSRRAEQRRRR